MKSIQTCAKLIFMDRYFSIGEDASFEEDLAKDVPEIITVFSARLYGSRSRKNQKLIDAVKKAAEDAQG